MSFSMLVSFNDAVVIIVIIDSPWFVNYCHQLISFHFGLLHIV